MACLIRLLDTAGTIYFDFFIKENSNHNLPVSIKGIKTDDSKTTIKLKKGLTESYQTIDDGKHIGEFVFPWESLNFTLNPKTPSALIYLQNQVSYRKMPITSITIEHMTFQELSKVEKYHNQNQNLSS